MFRVSSSILGNYTNGILQFCLLLLFKGNSHRFRIEDVKLLGVVFNCAHNLGPLFLYLVHFLLDDIFVDARSAFLILGNQLLLRFQFVQSHWLQSAQLSLLLPDLVLEDDGFLRHGRDSLADVSETRRLKSLTFGSQVSWVHIHTTDINTGGNCGHSWSGDRVYGTLYSTVNLSLNSHSL